MPETFFDIERNPFHKAPDPAHLFLAAQTEEAIARLEHGALQREITVLTGDIGVGKTTITRALVDRLDDDVQFVWILNPRLSATQLLQHIANGMGVKPTPRNKVELLDAIEHAVVKAWEAGRPIVLLVDEAQVIPVPETLEELRLLTNFQLDAENLLGMILVGQPELNRKLQSPRFRPLAQRVGVRFHLSGFDFATTQSYIQSRLEAAGRREPLFAPAAIERIYQYSRGIPRVINNVCGNALLAAYVKREALITPATIDDVAGDLGLTV